MTSTTRRSLRLTHKEFNFLQAESVLPAGLSKRIRCRDTRSAESIDVDVSIVDAESIRDALTERLARAGFDAAYDPTAEGLLLEDLIDRFA